MYFSFFCHPKARNFLFSCVEQYKFKKNGKNIENGLQSTDNPIINNKNFINMRLSHR